MNDNTRAHLLAPGIATRLADKICGTTAAQVTPEALQWAVTAVVDTLAVTYLGAPEAMNAAVAAGLCGRGSVFVGTAEGAARILQQHRGSGDIKAVAQAIVADHRTRKAAIPGIGHPIHKPIDPRTPRLFQLAKEQGYYGTACELMLAIAAEAEHSTGKSLPVNATGAIAAIATELGLDWRMCRGIAVMGRAIGLVGHIAEEIRNPVATEIWQRLDDEVGQAHSHLPNLG